jgi:hypothetical protein
MLTGTPCHKNISYLPKLNTQLLKDELEMNPEDSTFDDWYATSSTPRGTTESRSLSGLDRTGQGVVDIELHFVHYIQNLTWESNNRLAHHLAFF